MFIYYYYSMINLILTFYTVSIQDRNNNVDCGAFMCCCTYGIFKLKDEDIVFTNIDQRTQIDGCFHGKYSIKGDQSYFNFNMSCIKK